MPDSLLDSQFAALEDPRAEPDVITVSIERDISAIARAAADALRQGGHLPAAGTS